MWELCAECMAEIEGDPYVLEDRVVCKRCHDLYRPRCPHCGAWSKKAPRRGFRCADCGETVGYVPDHPYVWGSPYVTLEQQGLIRDAGVLSFLNYFIECTCSDPNNKKLANRVRVAAQERAYNEARDHLRARFQQEPSPRDVFWYLMGQQKIVEVEKLNEEIRQRGFRDDEWDRERLMRTEAQIDGYMKRFREWEESSGGSQ